MRTKQFVGPLFLLLLLQAALRLAPAQAAPTYVDTPEDAWWEDGWPYRIRVEAAGSGIVEAGIDFPTAFQTLGLNHALLDLRSIRVVPYDGHTPLAPIPYAETYSTMLEDADGIGLHYMQSAGRYSGIWSPAAQFMVHG